MNDDQDVTMADERAMAFVMGELSEEEAAEFRAHLAESPERQAEIESLSRTLAALSFGAVSEPPKHLRARILAAAARSTARADRRRAMFSIGRWAAAAVVAVAFAGLLAHNARLRRELDMEREAGSLLRQPNVTLSFSLKGEGPGAGSFGAALLDLDAARAAVVVHGLAASPADKIYRLWAEVEQKMVPCGEFSVDASGRVFSQIPIPVHAYTAPVKRLVLTMEPRSGPDHPVGPTIMIGT